MTRVWTIEELLLDVEEALDGADVEETVREDDELDDGELVVTPDDEVVEEIELLPALDVVVVVIEVDDDLVARTTPATAATRIMIIITSDAILEMAAL